MEAPEIRGEMVAGTADGAAVNKSALRLGFILRRFSKGIGLQFGMIGEQVFLQNFDFIVRKIGFGKVRALFEDDDAEAVGGKFFGEHAARGAGPHDDEVHGIGSFVLGLIDLHCLSASFFAERAAGAACQPG